MKAIVRDADIMKKIESKVVNYSKDISLAMTYDREEFERQVNEEEKATARASGIQGGASKRNIEIAKNMSDKDMDIKLISEITGLIIAEINDINGKN